MRDFSITIYETLLDQIKEANYHFQTCNDFFKSPHKRSVILRHDVDNRKQQSLKFAHTQYKRGIVGTYYFRIIPQSFDERIIREIHDMGHEIGYHYEDMDLANGNPQKAIKLFEKHLQKLRKVAPVSTICMHGSPMSKYDNRDLWKYYDYRSYEIIGEPYLDIDFKDIYYLTDTGRRWDGHDMSIRDKVQRYFDLNFHATEEIINAIKTGNFPNSVMFNFHPQRWLDEYPLWLKEKYTQQIKNLVKFWMLKLK